jgi:hypothetical protein
MAIRVLAAVAAAAAAGAAPVRAASEASMPAGDPGPALLILVAGALGSLGVLTRRISDDSDPLDRRR